MTLAAREALQPNRLGEPVLPIDARREEIIDALKRHQVIIVSGETGSGKTTQLPRLALAAGFGRRGMIGHTQPRRIAARSVANRLAVETGLALGEGIGFAVRFDDRTSDLSLVRVMTDGILLNDVQRDRMLSRYEVLIIDEAHERSLNIDFLLGIIKTLLPRRPDLKVIITSATIDHERFASFFENAPVIEVSGRSYPVKIEYADASIASDDSRELSRAVCDSVQTLLQRSLPSLAQDILVFLPGEREIRDCERALRKRGLLPAASWEILPLYGRLSDTLQQQVFKPGKQRRVVLATNVAETSLTVPRIGAVIDSGLARLKRYSSRTRIERLQVEAVSQASANQRAGRCGRIGPGICLRLFSQADFEARSEFTDAEILRSNLASVALQLEAMRLPGLDRFALLDRPDPSRIEDARRLLVELGALHRHKGITKLGKRLSRLPLDPRLGRMLLAPMPERLMPALVICVAGLSIQDPRQRPLEQAGKADAVHEIFADTASDFMALLNVWSAQHAARREQGRKAFEQWCDAHFLSVRRLREWSEVARQLAGVCDTSLKRMAIPTSDDERAALHAAILSGLVTQIGAREEGIEYQGTGRTGFALHPSSALRETPPRWVMALEIVQTRRRMARYCAQVSPAQVLRAANHLLEYEYAKPYFSSRRGRVEAKRTTLLQGLVLEGQRRVDFGRIDKQVAREIFVRQGLAADRVRSRCAFVAHNREQREAVAELAGKSRRLVEVSEAALAQWFAARVPQNIVDSRALQRWLEDAPQRDVSLQLSQDDLLAEVPEIDIGATPDTATLAGNTMQIDYRFAPDRDDDGATVRVPQRLLAALTPGDVEASVPAYLTQRIEARLRALPKADRKRLHPIAQRADALREQMSRERSAEALDDRLRRALLREFNINAAPDTWSTLVDPEYLRPRLVVVDQDGAPLAAGRDLQALQAQSMVSAPSADPASGQSEAVSKSVSRRWQFGTVAEHSDQSTGDLMITGYPALRRESGGVAVHEFLDRVQADLSHTEAVIALLRFRFAQQMKHIRKQLLSERQLQLLWSTFDDSGGAVLIEDVSNAVIRIAFPGSFTQVRSEAAWHALCEQGAAQLMPSATSLLSDLSNILQAHADVRSQLSEMPEAFGEAVEDVNKQIAALVFPGFLARTPVARICDLRRYLKAATLRLKRIASNASRDTQSMAMIMSLTARITGLGNSRAGPNQAMAIETFRWQVEELRVSLFAQSLGTREKVSMRRLEKRWDEILRMPD